MDSAQRTMLHIACINGDGIGPELMDSTREALRNAAEQKGVELRMSMESGGRTPSLRSASR